jgi:hypothetical protein
MRSSFLRTTLGMFRVGEVTVAISTVYLIIPKLC